MSNELRDTLNDLIEEIAITQIHLDCLWVVLQHYDDMRGDDKIALDHINRMNAMIDAHQQKLDKVMGLANTVWDVANGKAKPLQGEKSVIFETHETVTERTSEQWQTLRK